MNTTDSLKSKLQGELSYQNPQYLVETDWLERHLDDANLRIFDCSAAPAQNPDLALRKSFPVRPIKVRDPYDKEHIPGAVFLDVPGELADSSRQFPMMMPPGEQFVETMSQYGVNDDSRVVLYSTTREIWPARVLWMLRAVGFDKVAILNGGWTKWASEKRPVSSTQSIYPRGQLTLRSRPGVFVGKEEVQKAIEDKRVPLIHALSAKQFSGESGPVFKRKGRIPGSINIPSGRLTDPDTGTYLPAPELRQLFEPLDIEQAGSVITYCGGGVNASSNALALVLLGYENISVYDGSLNEWGNDHSLPVETE